MNSDVLSSIGSLEAKALAFSQTREAATLEAGELVQAFRWPAAQERIVLSRLAQKGLIVRVRNGLYLTPQRLPLGGKWNPGEYLALKALIDDRGGQYQISGPNAFSRYGWSEQIPNRIYVYNNRISGDRRIGTTEFTLIKVADERLGGTQSIRVPEGVEVVYASKARALVDAIYDWTRFDCLPRAYEWLKCEAAADDGFAADVVDAAVRFGNQVTLRRIGAALERLGAPANLLRKLERKIRPSNAYAHWIPNREKYGKMDKRWELVMNDG